MHGAGNEAERPAGSLGALAAPGRGGRNASHPKHALYAHVYEPLTLAWFREFDRARDGQIGDILAKPDPLLAMLLNLNQLFHDLVGRAVDRLDEVELNRMVAIVRRYNAEVMWMGYRAPADYTFDSIRTSLIAKLQRNISMGVIEAVLCLEAACRFAAESDPERRGRRLRGLLERSRQLYVSLAVLHDSHEQERFRELTGADDFLKYPATDYHHVLAGDVAIASRHLVEVGERDERSLRFRTAPRRSRIGASPVKKCPAQRLRIGGHGSPPLNDRLWDLLIEAYDRCGRFR